MKKEKQMNLFNFSEKRKLIVSLMPIFFVFIIQFCFIAHAENEAPNLKTGSISSSSPSNSTANNSSADSASQQSSTSSVSCQGKSCMHQGNCQGTFTTDFNAVSSAGQLLTASVTTLCPPGGVGARCGNRITDSGEDCDWGDGGSSGVQGAFCGPASGGVVPGWNTGNCNGAPMGAQWCGTNCKWAGCGNGVQEAGEQCDNGDVGGFANMTSGSALGDGGLGNNIQGKCLPGCKTNICGDGFMILQGAGPFDVCETGDPAEAPFCDNCKAWKCGIGKVDAGEPCDPSAPAVPGGNDPAMCQSVNEAGIVKCKLITCGNKKMDAGEACDASAPGGVPTDKACDATCKLLDCPGVFPADAATVKNAMVANKCYMNLPLPSGVVAGASFACYKEEDPVDNQGSCAATGSGSVVSSVSDCTGSCGYPTDSGKYCPTAGYTPNGAITVGIDGKSYLNYIQKYCCLCTSLESPTAANATYSGYQSCSTASGNTHPEGCQELTSNGSTTYQCGGSLTSTSTGLSNNIYIGSSGQCYKKCSTCQCEGAVGAANSCPSPTSST